MNDLVERLRSPNALPLVRPTKLEREAADHIERLAHANKVQAEEIQEMRERLASADREATSLLMAMVQQWPDVHPDWQPLPDVAGKITQINNMVAGLRARLAEAERLLVEGMDAIEGNGAWKSTWDAMRLFLYGTTDSASGVQSNQPEGRTDSCWFRCCLDYPRCDCNSPPEPDGAPALQPCGHPWKAQHDSKCILCSSPGVTP